jgi:hypothetical protein
MHVACPSVLMFVLYFWMWKIILISSHKCEAAEEEHAYVLPHETSPPPPLESPQQLLSIVTCEMLDSNPQYLATDRMYLIPCSLL